MKWPGSKPLLQRRSVAEPDWYWDAVVRDLGLRWSRPYTRVRDISGGLAPCRLCDPLATA